MPKLDKAKQVKTLRRLSKWSAFRRNPNRFKLLKQSMGALARDPARVTKSKRFGRGRSRLARDPGPVTKTKRLGRGGSKRFKIKQGRFE